MSTNPGLVERISLSLARSIRQHGGHPDVSVGTMRFALQNWISIMMIFVLSIAVSLLFGTSLQTLTSLVVLGILRYFSGGWHLRSVDLCIVFTAGIVIAIPLLPPLGAGILLLFNGASLLLVLLLAPTGHGQQFISNSQKSTFRWIAVGIVAFNFLFLHQVSTISILIQTLTLITGERR
jgi:accessory gene regulator B